VTYLDQVRSTYYFRRPVPLELKPYFVTSSGRQRVDWKETLRTKDRRIATERCNLRAVETDNEIRDARAKLRAGIPPAHGLTATLPPRAKVAVAHLNEEEIESAEVMDRHWREHDAEVEADPVRQRIADAVHEDRLRQDRERADAAALLTEVRKQKAVPLMDLFNAYVAERQPAPATVKRWRPVMDHIIAFLGHDDATQIKKVNVVAWKDALLAEKDADGEPKRRALTVKETYLASLKVMLEFGRENGPLRENAAADVKVRAPKKVKVRNPGFTDDEAATILRATTQPQPDTLSPEHRLARRWVPWLCAYTGSRVGEMAQLRAEDVKQIDGVWTVTITPEAGGVKSGKFRIVPLHPHLIEQGFPDVAANAKGPLFYNPERGRGGKDGNPHHKKVGERLGAWVRKLGVDDPNVQPNHAWRHRFETDMRRARVDYEARHVLVGHAHQTESGTYGEWDAVALKREIEKLPRFDLTAKPPTDAPPES
jgi:integrase